MKYHAHIYWTSEFEKEIALGLRIPLHNNKCGLGKIHDTQVGPHNFPMYQVSYDDSNKNFVEAFLKTHRNGLSILLHKITKEGDLYDHTIGARWLGNKLKLNLEIFEEE